MFLVMGRGGSLANFLNHGHLGMHEKPEDFGAEVGVGEALAMNWVREFASGDGSVKIWLSGVLQLQTKLGKYNKVKQCCKIVCFVPSLRQRFCSKEHKFFCLVLYRPTNF